MREEAREEAREEVREERIDMASTWCLVMIGSK